MGETNIRELNRARGLQMKSGVACANAHHRLDAVYAVLR